MPYFAVLTLDIDRSVNDDGKIGSELLFRRAEMHCTSQTGLTPLR